MTEPIVLTSDSPILKTLNFKPYRNTSIRRVKPFLPNPNEPQTMEVKTPWGATLTANKGDMLISEIDAPEDVWPIDPEIFDKTYMITEPGICIKRAVVMLVPLTEITNGDADQKVTIETLEGPETVRAGDFHLAKGIRGEIWAYPNDKVKEKMRLVE
ncbi:MAG: hypothetical protein KF758_14335 [Anaerolineales bacterium]|nr:hypothetical protein [Anaerolineales bacterium]MBX3038086.1 hypothetical protein [Anaerolineales bacterium]